MSLQLERCHSVVGSFHLGPMDLHLPQGAYGVLMGRTGSGKTTLLEVIAGLLPLTSGRLTIGGQACNHLRPADRVPAAGWGPVRHHERSRTPGFCAALPRLGG